MSKYPIELKVEVVKYCLTGNVSLKDTTKKYQVDKGDVQKLMQVLQCKQIQ